MRIERGVALSDFLLEIARGHEWLPRNRDEKPRVCPKCKSANWDRPKQATR